MVAKYIIKSTPEGDKIDADILDVDMVQVGAGYKLFPDVIRVLKPEDETRHTLISESTIPTAFPRSTASSSTPTTHHWPS